MTTPQLFELIENLYGPNAPNYQKRYDLIQKARTTYGEYGEYLKADLQTFLDGYAIDNQTDWNYDTCFSFMVCLHKGAPYPKGGEHSIKLVQMLGGVAYFLSLQISVLGPYYTCSFPQWVYDDSRHALIGVFGKPPSTDHKTVLKRIMNYCETKGLKRLDQDLLDQVAPGITLELAEEEGKVTVYNCLFADLPPD
jgi:hypothetical protein